MQSLPLIAARILLVPIFLASAFTKLTSWPSTTARIADASVPIPDVMLAGALILEIVGAVLVLLGLFTRIGAVMLLAFLVPVTLLMHPFWVDAGELTPFLKNTAIAGGLLMLAALGAGHFSLDAWRKRHPNP